MPSIALLSSGLWRIRDQVAAATGHTPVRWSFWSRPQFDVVGGWGLKPTSEKARALAGERGRPYVSLEDGFLRSIHPGPSEAPLSIVADSTGTHYNSLAPSDLETLVAQRTVRFTPACEARARRGIDRLAAQSLSKYNAAPLVSLRSLGFGARPTRGRVLVVDQTCGDASIAGAQADASTFQDMLAAAITENPGAEIIVKTHPEVASGRKLGYLSDAQGPGVRILCDAVNPWPLIESVDRVYTVSSQLGFEALIAGRPVTAFGAGFYAGWGLTDDRVHVARRTARPTIEQLFSAIYFDYARYVCPRTGEPLTFEEAVDVLVSARDRAHGIVRRPARQVGPLVPGMPAMAAGEELAVA